MNFPSRRSIAALINSVTSVKLGSFPRLKIKIILKIVFKTFLGTLFVFNFFFLVLFSGLFAPEKLKVDWITGNVYFIDTLKKHMGVCTESGSYCTVLINSSILDMPGGLALNPKKGEMFWSDYGKTPSIWTAGMDGSRPRTIVTQNVHQPKDLAIDYTEQRLYWIDSKNDVIESTRLDGTDRIRFVKMNGKKLRSLVVYNENLYWSEWHTNSIKSVNLAGNAVEKTIVTASDLIYDIAIHHSSLQPLLPNPCYGHKCEELCLLAPNRKQACACRVDQVLGSDFHTCSSIVEPHYLAIAAGQKVLQFRGEILGKVRIDRTLTSIGISRIVPDGSSWNLICDDKFTDALYSFDIRRNQVRLIAAPLYSQHLGGIDINHENNVISLSITNIRRIEEISLYNGARWNYTFAEIPLDILIVPGHKKRLVVFKSNFSEYHIDFLYFSKPHYPITIISNLIGPKISLAFDRHSQRVYFADEGTGNIESFIVNSECSNEQSSTNCYIDRRPVCSGVDRPVSLAIFDQKVYWTIRNSNVLQWVEIDDEYRAVKSKVLPIESDIGIINIVTADYRRFSSVAPM